MFGPNANLKALFRVIYCGIDLDRYTPGPKKHRLTVGQIGRLVDVKNHRFSLAVIHAVKQRCPDVVFEIVGDGENKGKLQSLAKDLMISKQVRFRGLKNDIPSVLQHMDILILPSLYEGLPVVAVESQAAGVPVIVSARVTDEACISAPHFVKLPLASPVAWADKIIELYESAPVPVDKTQFTRFHLKNTSQELYDLYREVL